MSSLPTASLSTPAPVPVTHAARGHGETRLSSLDSLRGVAILMVVGFHVSVAFPLPAAAAAAVQWGNLGVQLFFLVSAVTMAMMWDGRAHEPARVESFYIRRFFRIAPMYWLALVAYEGSTRLLGEPGHGWQPILLNLVFLHTLSPEAINSVVPGGWSIGVEMLFYAVFPLLVARGTAPMRMLWIGFIAYVVLGVVASWVALKPLGQPAIFVYYSLMTQFPIFPIGIAVYAVAVRGETLNRRHAGALVASWLLVAALGKWGLGLETRPLFWLQVFAFAALATWAVRGRRSVPGLAWIGSLSYSMYLLHFGVIDVVRRVWPAAWATGPAAYALALAVVLALTLLLSSWSRDTLERWSTRLGARIVAGVQRRAGGMSRSG